MAQRFGNVGTSATFQADSVTGEQVEQKSSNNAAHVIDIGFIPSSYSGNLTATTTVTGQSASIATGAVRLRVRNLDATNFVKIAFGESAAAAETNAANGWAVEFGQVETIGIPTNATHFAYVADTGTCVINVTQGV